jgi:hypothetical protein
VAYGGCQLRGSVTEQDADSAAGLVGHHQVGDSITVEVAHRRECGIHTGSIGDRVSKSSVAIPRQYGQRIVVEVGDGQIRYAVPVEIADRN